MIEGPALEATGKVAEKYDDIRKTLGMSMVNTIWRNPINRESNCQLEIMKENTLEVSTHYSSILSAHIERTPKPD